MKKFNLKSKIIAGVVAVAAVAAMSVPSAMGQWHVSGDTSESHTATGVIEVTVNVDDSATGGDVYAKLVIVPSDATVADVLNCDVISSNDQDGLKAIHNYDFETIANKVSKGDYKCVVAAADTQKPGCQTTLDEEGTVVTDYSSQTLNRYDNIWFIQQK